MSSLSRPGRKSEFPLLMNLMHPNEPNVLQNPINDFSITWNPDDDHFYVEKDDEVKARFKEWRNVVYYAKTH